MNNDRRIVHENLMLVLGTAKKCFIQLFSTNKYGQFVT